MEAKLGDQKNWTAVAYYRSPLGLLRIEGTERYICTVMFADDDSSKSPATRSNELLHNCIEELIEYFSGTRRTFTIPINQPGTDFQLRVWSELLNINFGKTISYADLAKRVGDPRSIRAAASGNGKNNISIIVPCHRVVGSNHSLVGYSGGLWRKKWLLSHENKIANGVQTLF